MSIAEFRERMNIALPHQAEVRVWLKELGCEVSGFDYLVDIPKEVRRQLGWLRWLPEFVCSRHDTGLFYADAKCENGQHQNFSVEQEALAAYLRLAEIENHQTVLVFPGRMACSAVYWDATAEKQIRTNTDSGSGTPYRLMAKNLTHPLDEVLKSLWLLGAA